MNDRKKGILRIGPNSPDLTRVCELSATSRLRRSNEFLMACFAGTARKTGHQKLRKAREAGQGGEEIDNYKPCLS